jgi:drug/metabolite transporter (DMT)-like permease
VVAPASLFAPFTYSQTIWALLAGYFVFDDFPDVCMLLGCTVTARNCAKASLSAAVAAVGYTKPQSAPTRGRPRAKTSRCHPIETREGHDL